MCADKIKDRAGDLRVLSLLEVHEVLQDVEAKGKGQAQKQHGLA